MPVGGRLSRFLPFWQSITSDQWVLQVVEHGYRLEFESPPISTGRRKTVLHRGGYDMSGEVRELYDNCSARYVPPDQVTTGVYSTYFLVDKKDGGKRPILNLKTLNRCLVKRPFKMETLSSIAPVLQLNTWMASIDLKDAYLHVPIFQDHWRFLRFYFMGQDLEYTVTPFGLSPAPMLFTRLVLAIVAWLRLRGVRIHAYLDDILLLGNSPEEVAHALQVTIHAFTSAGYIINVKKSDLNPTQDLVYIGGRFCTTLGKMLLPTDRKIALIKVVRTFFRVGARYPARSWLSVMGFMAATISTVETARLRMRPLQWFMKLKWKSRDLNEIIMVPLQLHQQLQWWTVASNLLEGRPFQKPVHTLTVTTDSSMEGWGGHILIGDQNLLFSGLWSRPERSLHINVLELRAIRLTLQRVQSQVSGQVVRCECDNQQR